MHRFPVLVLCVVLFLVSIPPWLHGQVNIEALRAESSDTGITGNLGIDFSLRTGNVELVKLGVDARVDRMTGKSTTLLLVNTDLGFLSGNRFTNDGLFHLRHGRTLGGRIMPEGFGQLNYDKARLLDLRAVVGCGVRWSLAEEEHSGFSLGSGIMFEHEQLGATAGGRHPQRTDAFRSSSYLVVRVDAGRRFVLSTTGYAQPTLDEPGDFRLLHNLEIGMAITGSVSLRIQFQFRYDSRPPDGITRLDTELTNGLLIRF